MFLCPALVQTAVEVAFLFSSCFILSTLNWIESLLFTPSISLSISLPFSNCYIAPQSPYTRQYNVLYVNVSRFDFSVRLFDCNKCCVVCARTVQHTLAHTLIQQSFLDKYTFSFIIYSQSHTDKYPAQRQKSATEVKHDKMRLTKFFLPLYMLTHIHILFVFISSTSSPPLRLFTTPC